MGLKILKDCRKLYFLVILFTDHDYMIFKEAYILQIILRIVLQYLLDTSTLILISNDSFIT